MRVNRLTSRAVHPPDGTGSPMMLLESPITIAKVAADPDTSAARPPDPTDLQQARRLATYVGKEILDALADDTVTEIYVNADGRIWIDRLAVGNQWTGHHLDAHFTTMFLNAVASDLRLTLDPLHPSIEAELPESIFAGARLQGEVPPITRAPSFNIRKHSRLVFSLDQLEAQGVLTAGHKRVIRDIAVPEHWNIVVCGWTNSGKTFLAKSILKEISAQFPNERILMLEDTLELVCESADQLSLKKPKLGTITEMTDLLSISLRRRPNRIAVGEVRDRACLAMLDAWCTHEGGVATVHAKSPEGCLDRMDRLCMRNGVPSDRRLVAEAVQLVILIKGDRTGRRVRDIVCVEPQLGADGQYVLRRFDESGEIR
jgi:type IV secretion system protein TrbB